MASIHRNRGARTFNGRRFYEQVGVKRKTVANARAAAIRKGGHLARVIKDGAGYIVYAGTKRR